ncbi:cyclic nucleotide-binding-like protein [Chytriomyces sp. MP71]|nr:cyclic nucleotide-binding-like protein [Chytriomyces sp. MP71]
MKEQNDRQRKGSLFEDEQLPSEDSTSKKEKPGSPLMRMAEPTQDYEVVTTPFHGWFICKAFDEKGRRIPYEFREADTHGQISFWKSGFHPMSMFGAFSTTISIVVYFFTLLMELYFASYVPEVRSYAGISWAISLLFLLETIVNFLSPQARGNVHYEGARYNLKDWCTHYLKSKLILDFVSMVPWVQLIVLPDYAFPLSLLRLLRFNKLPKMMSHNPLLLQFITGIESIGGIGAILSRIIPMGVVFIIFLHFQACFLYYVGQLNRFSTWSEQFDHWRFFPGGIEAASTQDRYLWVLSMSIGNVFQMTFKPQTSLEQSTTLVFIIFGAILYALLVGLLSSAAVAYDASGRLYRQKIDELTEYLNWKKIDGVTKRKVISYYEYKYRGKYFEEQQLLADMNNSLKMELAIITCRRLIEKVPFLKREVSDGRDDIYIGKISTALQAVHYVTGDFIFHQGEIGTDMFFIQTGAVNILTNGRFITNLKDGSFFGEVALIANVPRTASIQAATNCTLYRLNSSDFNAIIVEFEDMKIRVDQIYKDRMIKIQQASKQKGKGISKMM